MSRLFDCLKQLQTSIATNLSLAQGDGAMVEHIESCQYWEQTCPFCGSDTTMKGEMFEKGGGRWAWTDALHVAYHCAGCGQAFTKRWSIGELMAPRAPWLGMSEHTQSKVG